MTDITDKIAAWPPRGNPGLTLSGASAADQLAYFMDETTRAEAERDLALEVLRQFQFRAAITPPTKNPITAYHYWGPNPQDIEAVLAACGKGEG